MVNRMNSLATTILKISFLLTALFLFVGCNYASDKVVNGYLQAIKDHNYDELKIYGDLSHDDSIFINLIDWKILRATNLPDRKESFNLSKLEYKQWLEVELDVHNVSSIEEIPDDSIRAGFKNYESWRAYEIDNRKLFEENGKHYYIDDAPEKEYLLDIRITNKLGMELKFKYVVIVEYRFGLIRGGKYSKNWKVISAKKR